MTKTIDEIYANIEELSPEDISDLAVICDLSFKAYCQVMFFKTNDAPFMMEKFHSDLIQLLQDVADGKIHKKYIIINLPVGSGKTTISELWISWCFGRNPNMAFCYTSNSGSLVKDLSTRVRDVIDTDLFKNMFKVNLKVGDMAKTDWSLQQGSMKSGLRARGMESKGITGLNAGNPAVDGFSGAGVADDPLAAGDERSEVKILSAIHIFESKLKSRPRTPSTPWIIIGQRLCKRDLSGYILDNYPDDVHHFVVKAIQEDEQGNEYSYWEKLKPLAFLQQERRKNNYVFKAQYQQDPINSGGAVFHIKYFNYWEIMPQCNYRIITGDTAMKTKESSDYSVFQCWGYGKDGNLYLIDQIRGKWEAPELRRQCVAFWNKHKSNDNYDVRKFGALRKLYIEDKVSGTGLIQDIKAGDRIPVAGIQRSVDKYTRVSDILGYIESGYVYLPEDAEWLSDFKVECENFTDNDTHEHDDQIDPMCDGITILKSSMKTPGVSINKIFSDN